MNTNLVILQCLIIHFLTAPWTYITTPRVDYPQPGQAVQGVILISGSTNINGFQSAEISFSYSGGDVQEGDWFLIQNSYEPVEGQTLAVWDTTTIADGEYNLRVKVYLENGRSVETIVENLRVRNYSPIETSTPQPVLSEPVQDTPVVIETEQPPNLTPTILPTNPVELTSNDIQRYMVSGAVLGVGMLVLVGLYAFFRKIMH